MRPILYISFFLGLLSFNVHSQSTPDSAAIDPEKVYNVVDVQPEPIGGMSAFFKTISKNIIYPQDARQQNITGKVIVQFVVERDGSIREEHIKVARAVFKSLDEDAVRVVLLTSPWQPGTVHGQPVRALKTLPISFNLGGVSPARKN